MQRRGGLAAWRLELDPARAGRPVVPPTPSTPPSRGVARRAYFIALQRGGDPVSNWLAAETELLAA